MSDRTITVNLDGNKTADLQIEERVYPDRSCNQYESGWRAYDLNTETEYFVSDTGVVWVQPENRDVGVCPELKEEFDRWLELENRIEEMSEYDMEKGEEE